MGLRQHFWHQELEIKSKRGTQERGEKEREKERESEFFHRVRSGEENATTNEVHELEYFLKTHIFSLF